MSRAGLRVVFPDGTVRCGIYEGTVDIAYPWLYDTDREAWDNSRNGHRRGEEPVGEVFDVVIYSDYGGGFWWHGKAAKNVITEGCDTWPYNGTPIKVYDGMPERVREFYNEQAAIYRASKEA
jgi:hypothetical protein